MKQQQIAATLALTLALILASSFGLAPQAQELRWRQADPETVPTGRDDHMMTFMDELGEVLMYGGDNASSGTWFFNGSNWQDLGFLSPGFLREAVIAYDTENDITLFYGGSTDVSVLTNLWKFDGKGWLFINFPEIPGPREDAAAVYHQQREQLFLYGGDGADGATYVFDGAAWRELVSQEDGPGLRWGHRMVYDSARNRVVMFGGFDSAGQLRNDTWEFDGNVWVEVTPTTSPSPRRDFAMVYDVRRGVTMLIGGRNESPEGFNDVWQWNGTTWVQVGNLSGPSPRHELAATYDTWHNRIIMFGGSSGSTLEDRYKNDTWILEPNLPRVVHTPRFRGNETNTPFRVTCRVENVRSNQLTVILHYREVGKQLYSTLEMNRHPSGNHTALIPASEISDNGFEYYISAVDAGITEEANFWRHPENPQRITVGRFGNLKGFVFYEAAREAGVRWRIKGTEQWYADGDVIRRLEPGTYTIEVEDVEGAINPDDFEVEVHYGDTTVARIIVPI